MIIMKVPEDYINPEIGIDHLPPVTEIKMHSLEPKFYYQMFVSVSIVYLVLLMLLLLLYLLETLYKDAPSYEAIPISVYITTTSCLILLWIGNILWLRKAYDYRGYALRSKDISMRKGLFFRKYRSIPFNNIQQVSVEQGPISRLFKLYKLVVTDASQGGRGIVIPGLSKDRANALKESLLEHIS